MNIRETYACADGSKMILIDQGKGKRQRYIVAKLAVESKTPFTLSKTWYFGTEEAAQRYIWDNP